MTVKLILSVALLLNAFALSIENPRLATLSTWLMILAGFGYGLAIGWWGYDKYHGVF